MTAMTGQGRPQRPDDHCRGPWDGQREDAERMPDLVASEVELAGGGRSRWWRRSFPGRGHGRDSPERASSPFTTFHFNKLRNRQL